MRTNDTTSVIGPKKSFDEAPDDLAQGHPTPTGDPPGLGTPAPHAEHLERGGLAPRPTRSSPQMSIADPEGDDEQRER